MSTTSDALKPDIAALLDIYDTPLYVLCYLLDSGVQYQRADSQQHSFSAAWVQLWLLRPRPIAEMASTGRGTKAVYHREGIDPCICATHYGECVPITSFRTPPRKRYSAGINDESGLHHDYEPFGPLRGSASSFPRVLGTGRTGCGLKGWRRTHRSASTNTIAPVRTPVQGGQDRRRTPKAAGDRPRRAAVVPVAGGRLDGSTEPSA
jgi:hypothetical protein